MVVDMQQFSFAEVGEILGLIKRMDCDTFTLEYGELKISVQRAKGASVTAAAEASAALAGNTRARAVSRPATETDSAASVGHGDSPERPDPDETMGWDAVTAPMAGTFYRSPEPGKPPWVKVGDPVDAGQTVGVIEVMKLFTELKAERAGTVVRIDGEEAALVEYEQPLVWIDPR
jgi:acetyl-CoA carboxylase biotin carboxyl carrier protein